MAMKSQATLKLLTKLGPVAVLLLLIVMFSVMLRYDHQPQTPQHGTELARSIVSEYGVGASVIVLTRPVDGDRPFGDAIEKELAAQGVEAVQAFSGHPRQIREFLDVIAANQAETVAVIATNHPTATLKFLEQQKLRARGGPFASTAVMIPPSYPWSLFLTADNFKNLLNNSSRIAIIAVGMTLVIITAGIDLSVGGVMALASVMTAVAINSWFGGAEATFWGLVGGCAVGVGMGAACGLFNGMVTTFLRVPPFIVTLAMFMIAPGLAMWIATGGSAVASPEAIDILAKSFHGLSTARPLGIPVPIYIVLALYLLAHIVMTRTSFGRYVYAVGGNREAARLSGVPVFLVLISVYTLCGAAAGLSGVIDASLFGGRPTGGNLYELQAIAAVVVGGTSIAGGEGRVTGTLIGTLIIAVIDSGLSQLGIGSYKLKVVFGALILATVVLDQLKHRYASSAS